MAEIRGRHITLHRLYTAWAPHLTPRAFKLLIAIASALGGGDRKFLSGYPHALKWSSFDGPLLLMEKSGIKSERRFRDALAELKSHNLIFAYSRGRQNGHVINPHATPAQTVHDPCPNGPKNHAHLVTQKLSSLEAIEEKLWTDSVSKTKTAEKTGDEDAAWDDSNDDLEF